MDTGRYGMPVKECCWIAIAFIDLIPERFRVTSFQITCSQGRFARAWRPIDPNDRITLALIEQLEQTNAFDCGMQARAGEFCERGSGLGQSAFSAKTISNRKQYSQISAVLRKRDIAKRHVPELPAQ